MQPRNKNHNLMKKLSELVDINKLSLKELFSIKGGVMVMRACDTYACTNYACSTVACSSLACTANTCSSSACRSSSCTSNSSQI